MKKLQGEIIKMGKFLSKKGNTLDKWMGMQENVNSESLTGQDKQAYEWAKANPEDPRAKQILSRLGI